MADTKKEVDLSDNSFLDGISLMNFEPDEDLLEELMPLKTGRGSNGT